MTNKLIFETLLSDIQEQKIKRVIVGLNWILLETALGCGLAQTPKRDTNGCFPLTEAGNLRNLCISDIAKWVRSTNPIKVAIGLAAINAFYNRYDLDVHSENGLDVFADIEGPVISIGRFPGMFRRFKNVQIVEREPVKGEYNEKELLTLLPESAGIVMTSSTLINNSAGKILNMAKEKPVCMVGPSTPFAPKLGKFGISTLAGTVVNNVEGMAVAVMEAGDVQALKPFGSFKTLYC